MDFAADPGNTPAMKHHAFAGPRTTAFALALVLCGAVPVPRAADTGISPLPNAHAHNDYEHARPLFDALDQGFCSVEADVFLVEGRLLVAHDRAKVQTERTLEALYLDPLRDRARANGGRIYPNGPEFFLLIDFKTEAETTWPALRAVLDRYAGMLTTFTTNATRPGAVTVIISGNSPRAGLAAEPVRPAALDGRLADLNAGSDRHLVPWVSENWSRVFEWRGTVEMPDAQRAKLREIAAKAHQQGRRVRFWGAPDREPLWREQVAAGVDLINTDNLAGLRQFLLTNRTAAATGPR
jgi:hypothetical protein